MTKDPETKLLSSGTTGVDFGLAFSEKYKDDERTCFVDCSAFSGLGETIAKNFSKGKSILVEGKLQYDTWEKDGQKRSKHKVIVTGFRYVDTKGASVQPVPDGVDGNIPF